MSIIIFFSIMRMKFILILTLALSSLISFSQHTYLGKISDNQTGNALAYVNIGIVGKNIGTVSNSEGNFKIVFDEKFDEDTIRISMIGYKSLDFKVINFKNEILNNPSIQLEQNVFAFKEVVISHKKLKEKVLGNETESKVMLGGFTSNELGNEVGVVIKIKKSPTYIESFSASIASNKYDSLKFRLNFYDLKDGFPDKSVLKENIIIYSQIKQGRLTVDLREYNIVVRDDFFISLEWIENLGEDGLFFSLSVLGGPLLSKHTSQGEWEKVAPVGIGFSVLAKY